MASRSLIKWVLISILSNLLVAIAIITNFLLVRSSWHYFCLADHFIVYQLERFLSLKLNHLSIHLILRVSHLTTRTIHVYRGLLMLLLTHRVLPQKGIPTCRWIHRFLQASWCSTSSLIQVSKTYLSFTRLMRILFLKRLRSTLWQIFNLRNMFANAFFLCQISVRRILN